MATKLAFLGESQFTQKHRRVASESCKAIHCLFAVPNKRTNSFWKNSCLQYILMPTVHIHVYMYCRHAQKGASEAPEHCMHATCKLPSSFSGFRSNSTTYEALAIVVNCAVVT